MSVSASISVNISMVSVHGNRFIFQCGSAHPGSVLVSVEVLIHDGPKFSQRYIEWRITTILCILCYYIIPKKRNTEWTIWTSCNFPKYVALNSCTAADDWVLRFIAAISRSELAKRWWFVIFQLFWVVTDASLCKPFHWKNINLSVNWSSKQSWQ